MDWTPESWRQRPVQQQPTYDNAEELTGVLAQLRSLPPLVSIGEVDTLRKHMAAASRGKAFILQGGDCAERFVDCNSRFIEARLKILLQMSLVLTWGARIPVVRIARMAGQYAKPRSSNSETVGDIEIPSYRGDHVNDIAASLAARQHDPQRLLQAYFRSAVTLNYARALLDGGFADLHHPDHWDLAFVKGAANRADYEEMIKRILDAIDFVESTGVHDADAFRTIELFASHEGLLLEYETAHTSQTDAGWYNLGAHMLWIGERTRQIDGAHVEYFRGLENPVGIKVGPTILPDELVTLLETVEPQNRPGRVMVITRLGHDNVDKKLTALIEAVSKAEREVVWSCDPMHGNTMMTDVGLKTRDVRHILKELHDTFRTHDAMNTFLGGVHFELTGEDVTECTGGPQQLSEADLTQSYETYCDPRLNYSQSLEMAFLMAQDLQRRRKKP